MPLWPTDFIVEGDDMWFISGIAAVLMRYSISENKLMEWYVLPIDNIFQENAYSYIYNYNSKLFLIPIWGKDILVFDLNTEKFAIIAMGDYHGQAMFNGIGAYNNYLYCMPMVYPYMVVIDMNKSVVVDKVECFDFIKNSTGDIISHMNASCIVEERYMVSVTGTNRLLWFDMKKHKMWVEEVDDVEAQYSNITYVPGHLFVVDNERNILQIVSGSHIDRAIDLPKNMVRVTLQSFEKKVFIDDIRTPQYVIFDPQNMHFVNTKQADGFVQEKYRYSYYTGVLKTDMCETYYFNRNDCTLYGYDGNEFKKIVSPLVDYKQMKCQIGCKLHMNVHENIFSTLSNFIELL